MTNEELHVETEGSGNAAAQESSDKPAHSGTPSPARRDGNKGDGNRDKGGRSRTSRDRRDNQPEEKNEWKEKVIQIRRVTKVVKGGKKLSFRAVVAVGNGEGEVGLGVGKSGEVVGAIQKAVAAAKKALVKVRFHKTTIPHPVQSKASGSIVILRPASEGTGIIAGGAARAVLDLSGVGNILAKSLGSSSPLNVARATVAALSELRTFEEIASRRGKTVKEMLF
jgi:small subunit ribosomal protein S5